MTNTDTSGAVLSVDLDAVQENWRLLDGRIEAETAAVVKADGYGLGAERVAPALAAAGCKTFFVALIDEGIRLRKVLPDLDIHVLGGLLPGTEAVFREHNLTPTLNSLEQISAWAAFCSELGKKLPATIHIDTGMSRLGLSPRELQAIIEDPSPIGGFTLTHVLSHLACADEPEHAKNAEQLAAFRQAATSFGDVKLSFANSAGIFLGPEYHFDLARPGIALYGSNPVPDTPNQMAQVVRLQGKIVQVRDVDTPQTVGYGATHTAGAGTKIATVSAGYADGYLRSLSNRASGYIGDIRVPLVGRVSMDLITFDVSDVSADALSPGAFIDLIGPNNPVDTLAADAGTIGYEILTRLGARYHRRYVGG